MKRTNDDKGLNSDIPKHVSALYDLMKGQNLDELEVKENGFYIYLKRKTKASAKAANYAPQQQAAHEESERPQPQEEKKNGQAIKSPITGIFYRAPSPASSAFVQEGDVVDQGKTLCIVEAMKVMNEIKAEAKVRIAKILVENGKSVESQQELFLIEKI